MQTPQERLLRRSDPDAFVEWCKLLGFQKVYRSERYDRFFEFLDSDARRKLVLMPRGTYKSTCLCAWCMREIVRRPDIRIMYGSETLLNAKQYLSLIKNNLERNGRFHEIFGGPEQWVSKDQWRQDSFTVARRANLALKEPTMSTCAIEQTKTGMHFDVVVVDDPVSQTNVGTTNQLEKTWQWYQLLLSILEPDGAIVVCGTRYDDEDLYGHLVRQNPELEKLWASLSAEERRPDMMPYEIMIERASESDGTPRFKHLDRAFLAKKLVEQGSYIYQCQYNNDVLTGGHHLFKREQFKLIPVADIPRDLNIYMLSDSATTPEGCFSTMFVIGKDVRGTVYVLDASVGHWTPHDYVESWFSMWTKWNPRKCLLEKVPINDTYAEMLDREGRARRIPTRIEWILGRTESSKDDRIIGSQGRFEAGSIFFSEAIPRDLIRLESGVPEGEIVHQYVRFRPRSGSRNDIPDTLADMDRRDRRTGAELCPPPRRGISAPSPAEALARSEPGMVNRRYNPAAFKGSQVGTPGEDFWSRQKRLSDRRRNG